MYCNTAYETAAYSNKRPPTIPFLADSVARVAASRRR